MRFLSVFGVEHNVNGMSTDCCLISRMVWAVRSFPVDGAASE
jgi:hypothetical protein